MMPWSVRMKEGWCAVVVWFAFVFTITNQMKAVVSLNMRGTMTLHIALMLIGHCFTLWQLKQRICSPSAITTPNHNH